MKCPHCHREISKEGGLRIADRISYENELKLVDHEIKVIQSNYGDHQTWCQDDRVKIKPLLVRRKLLRGILGRIV